MDEERKRLTRVLWGWLSQDWVGMLDCNRDAAILDRTSTDAMRRIVGGAIHEQSARARGLEL